MKVINNILYVCIPSKNMRIQINKEVLTAFPFLWKCVKQAKIEGLKFNIPDTVQPLN